MTETLIEKVQLPELVMPRRFISEMSNQLIRPYGLPEDVVEQDQKIYHVGGARMFLYFGEHNNTHLCNPNIHLGSDGYMFVLDATYKGKAKVMNWQTKALDLLQRVSPGNEAEIFWRSYVIGKDGKYNAFEFEKEVKEWGEKNKERRVSARARESNGWTFAEGAPQGLTKLIKGFPRVDFSECTISPRGWHKNPYLAVDKDGLKFYAKGDKNQVLEHAEAIDTFFEAI